MFAVIIMKEKTCETCVHFHQHYTKPADKADTYIWTMWGHCVYPRIKARQTNKKACEHYKPKETEKQPSSHLDGCFASYPINIWVQ